MYYFLTMYLYIGCNGFVAAMDPANGREVWRVQLGGLMAAGRGEDVCVLEHEGKVYAGCHGAVHCLDGATGKQLWVNELSGMGYNDVTMALKGVAIQYVSSKT
jgi:outer membrane protein assembly factor BamB